MAQTWQEMVSDTSQSESTPDSTGTTAYGASEDIAALSRVSNGWVK